MQIIVINGQAVVFSWVSGVVVRKDDALIEEARKNFDAVINRLLREGKEDEAEEIFLILAGR